MFVKKESEMVVPYNTGKVLIGLMYQPANTYSADEDAVLIQRALINQRRTFWQRFKFAMGVRYDDVL